MLAFDIDTGSKEWAELVAQDLLWHLKHADTKKMREAILKVAFYYMTFDEVVQYMGSTEAAEEVFNDQ